MAPSTFTGLEFELDPAHEAHEPPEVHGVRRDDVRLLVSEGTHEPIHARFADLGAFLRPGDLVVVNTSATYPAAFDGRLPDGEPVVVHLSGRMPDDSWLVEIRRPDAGATAPIRVGAAVDVDLFSGGRVRLVAPFAESQRLWMAELDVRGPVLAYAGQFGRPIRYRYVTRDWPIGFYQSIFSSEPGSAEMPSAARPFTGRVIADLIRRGIAWATVRLDTGVSSLEGHERPYPERYEVPPRDRRGGQCHPSPGRACHRARHDRRASAGERHRPRRRCTRRGRAGRTSSSARTRRSARWTASSPDGTSRRPRIS